MVECRTFGRGDRGSKEPVVEHQTIQLKGLGFKTTSAVSKLGQLRLPHFASLSEETVKAIGPFYLVPMPGQVKKPHKEMENTCCRLTKSRDGKF